MQDLIDLAQAGAVGISIILVIAIVYIVRYFLDYLKNEAKHHLKAYQDFKKSMDKNTKVTNEMYQYLKLRNGLLRKENNKINK